MSSVALCGFEGPPGRAAGRGERARGPVSPQFPVAIAWGKHLFPFRTEQLSPTAPMVLGPQGPGRVGRRRSLPSEEPPPRRFFVVLGRRRRPRSRPNWPRLLRRDRRVRRADGRAHPELGYSTGPLRAFGVAPGEDPPEAPHPWAVTTLDEVREAIRCVIEADADDVLEDAEFDDDLPGYA